MNHARAARFATALAVAVTTAVGLVPAAVADTAPTGGSNLLSTPPAVSRLAGTDRYATSAAAAAAFTRADVVFLATGENWPDALAGAAAAGFLHAPVLLTPPAQLSSAAAAQIARLHPKHVYVLGGESVVSPHVQAQAAAYAPTSRLSGADRYATAVAISRTVFPGGADSVLLATGTNWPDALAGAAASTAARGPVLVTPSGSLDSRIAAEIRRLRPKHVYVLGSTDVVSAQVQSQAGAIAPTSRLAGADRYATADVISGTFFSGAPSVYLATGQNWPDALSGAALASGLNQPSATTATASTARAGAPLLLVPRSYEQPATWGLLRALKPTRVGVLGSSDVVTKRLSDDLGLGRWTIPTGSFAVNRASDGTVLRWNPCRTITYRVNDAQATAGALTDVVAAMGQVSAATGLRFQYAGRTSEIPNGSRAPSTADLVIAWATPAQSAALGGTESGDGGWFATGRWLSGSSYAWSITSGFVVLDSTKNGLVRPGFGSGATRGALLLHEIGHAVGLDHVDDRAQVMNPVLGTWSHGYYGGGDRTGLAVLGSGAGCIG